MTFIFALPWSEKQACAEINILSCPVFQKSLVSIEMVYLKNTTVFLTGNDNYQMCWLLFLDPDKIKSDHFSTGQIVV